ncbi:hypothetical protein A3F06_00395 [candidate division TM6 bacterium RIFCSPHIGHO2_12_FULL_36_22]|nr:MAG: hypothetical protein A3F06_00395 [candidate division TM6 bacterium RIFCSPHIGHO2_12_FULL_36_22]
MPELLEFEAYKYVIKSKCLNKKIDDVESSAKSLVKDIPFSVFKKGLINQKFDSVDRKGRYLIIHVSSGDKLVMHFGLTGFLIYSKDTNVKFSRVNILFKNTDILRCKRRA